MRNYNNETIYERIEAAWNRIGCKTQADFSKISGIPKGTISRWKDGTIPGTDLLTKICNCCDCDIDYLLGKLPPTCYKRENVSVHTQTGLSETAVEQLKAMQLVQNDVCTTTIDFLSFLITNDHLTEMIKHILNYCEAAKPRKHKGVSINENKVDIKISQLKNKFEKDVEEVLGLQGFSKDIKILLIDSEENKQYEKRYFTNELEQLAEQFIEKMLEEYQSENQ